MGSVSGEMKNGQRMFGARTPGPAYLFEGQLQHLMLLALLIPGTLYLAQPALDGSSWLGIRDWTWFYAVLVVAIIHQVLGWFVFRSQLVFGLFTRLLGNRDLIVWALLFMPLLWARVLLLVGLGLADAGSLTWWRGLQIVLGLILLGPALYTLWSVAHFFGLWRALGADHFRQAYRTMPLVKAGAFRYSPNAMYAFAFLGLWAIALLFGSRAALIAALFQHAYIWVHMCCTEDPDMRLIYG
jgi:hypothetical protein